MTAPCFDIRRTHTCVDTTGRQQFVTAIRSNTNPNMKARPDVQQSSPPVHIQQAKPMMIPQTTTADRETASSSLPVAWNTAKRWAQMETAQSCMSMPHPTPHVLPAHRKLMCVRADAFAATIKSKVTCMTYVAVLKMCHIWRYLWTDVFAINVKGEQTGSCQNFSSSAGGDSHEAHDDNQDCTSLAKIDNGHSWQDQAIGCFIPA